MASENPEPNPAPSGDAFAQSVGHVEGLAMKFRKSPLDLTAAAARGRGIAFAPLAAVLVLAMLVIETPFANPSGAVQARPKAKASASPAPRPTVIDPPAFPKLDSARVHKLYLEGDFDEAIGILENNLKDPRQYRHEDSVFIFKHLGVMYAAQYETREKGKYFMHRLLMVEPTAKIMDMYASDMIYMIFKNIQEEFEQNRMQLTLHTSGTMDPKPDTARPPKQEPKGTSSNGKAWIWAGAAVATVAAGVGTYFLMTEEPKTTVRNHNVPQ
jgi:hypothetical protein